MTPRKVRKRYPKRKASDETVEAVRACLKQLGEAEIEDIASGAGVRPVTASQALKQIGAPVVRYIPREGRGARKKVWGLP